MKTAREESISGIFLIRTIGMESADVGSTVAGSTMAGSARACRPGWDLLRQDLSGLESARAKCTYHNRISLSGIC